MPTPIGLDSLHYAILQEGTDTKSSAPIYTTPPIYIAPAITATVTPNVQNTNIPGDDGIIESVSTIPQIEIALNTADLPLDVQAALLGSTIGADGILTRTTKDLPPYVALLFRTLLSDGTYRFYKFLKGRFQEPEISAQTKGESVEPSTPTINGNFVKRKYDDQLFRKADEGQNGFSGAATWFDNVDPAA